MAQRTSGKPRYPREWQDVADACAALLAPPAHRVGDFLVRAVASLGRTGASGSSGEIHDDAYRGVEPFAIAAALVMSAGWRWARRVRPRTFCGVWCNPAERWAYLELAAGTAVNRAAMLEAQRYRDGRRGRSRSDLAAAAWREADRLQRRALGLWLSERVQVVVQCTGVALVFAVYQEGEYRFRPYVE